MATPKKSLNLAVPEELLREFNQVCAAYGHGKQKGMVLSAAILMFLKADPIAQGRCLEEIARADISAGVKAMLRRAKSEQELSVALRDATRQARDLDKIESAPAGRIDPITRQARAARVARPSRKGVTRLPKLDDFKAGGP